MMSTVLSVRGKFENGVARPEEPVEGHEGQTVIITFLEKAEATGVAVGEASAWDAVFQLIDDYATETGIVDLAEQHHHYLYGVPKHEASIG